MFNATMMSTLLKAVLSPPANTTPTTPAESPALWSLLAFARRDFERAKPVSSPIVNPVAGQATTAAQIAASAGQPATFTGEPSLEARLLVLGLRILKFFGLDYETHLAPLLSSPSPPPFTTQGITVRRTEFEGMAVVELQPANPSGKFVVGLHGGAYVLQPTFGHWSDYASVARDTGATVVVPIYPLAPEGTASAVVPVLADFITSQIDRHGAENVGVYGDSAGGALGLAAVQELVIRGAAVPSHMVLISPWLDVTLSHPAVKLIDDPFLNLALLRRDGRLWAGDLDPKDPRVSPLYGSLEGLPPTAVYAGSLELLAPDVLVLQDKALATPDAEFTFILRKGEIHNWPIFPLPESLAVRPDIYRQLGLVDSAT